MVRDFASFATEPAPGARFDLEHAFAPLAEAPEVELVAVPYSSLPPERPAAAVVMAAGLAAEQLAVLPAANDERTPSGPLLVAASRLLSKRAFRHGLSGSLPRTRLLEGAAHLQELARQGHWDQGGYWGWTPSQRRAAIGRYTRGNDAFASARWGRPWGDDWSDGMFTDTDLASADPPLVVEVLDAVDLVFRELKASRAAAASD
jgi:hypothetical protein